MKTPEELKTYYEAELLPELTAVDAKRKTAVIQIFVLTAAVAFVFLFLCVVAFVFDTSGSTCGVVLCCPLPILMALWSIGFNFIKGGYVKGFKSGIIQKIVKFIDPALEYSADRGLNRDVFNRSRIFQQTPERYMSEDYVSGTLGKTKIEFSEVHAEDRRETRDSRGRRQTHYVTIFKGILFVADFNKNFKGSTLVLPDAAEKMLGGWLGSMLQSKNFTRPPLVKLEDPEFEKQFVVYGDDQVESRYILSTSLMARITEFRKKSGRDIFLSFLDNNVIVALPYKKNLFEPRLFRSIVDYAQVEEYYNDLQFVLSIVEDLNLNTRIWGKA